VIFHIVSWIGWKNGRNNLEHPRFHGKNHGFVVFNLDFLWFPVGLPIKIILPWVSCDPYFASRAAGLWIRCLSLVEDMHCLRWAADDVTSSAENHLERFFLGKNMGKSVLPPNTGWWFGTFFIFPYIGNVIIPTDELIFFATKYHGEFHAHFPSNLAAAQTPRNRSAHGCREGGRLVGHFGHDGGAWNYKHVFWWKIL
jgi:hypothetical protein